MANNQNLKPWQPGQSGNPAGKQKGTKHVNTWIRELLNDDDFVALVRQGRRNRRYKGAPIEAMIKAQVVLAMNGDTKAFDTLLKHGWGKTEQPSMEAIQNPIQFINNVPITPDCESLDSLHLDARIE